MRIYASCLILGINYHLSDDFGDTAVCCIWAVTDRLIIAMASKWTISVKVITGDATKIQAPNGPVS